VEEGVGRTREGGDSGDGGCDEGHDIGMAGGMAGDTDCGTHRSQRARIMEAEEAPHATENVWDVITLCGT
jgi:hypothetical protein